MVPVKKAMVTLLVVIWISVWVVAQEAAPAPLPMDAAPLVLKDLQGQEQSLSRYRGKIVVLNFWATWCVPCRQEMPVFVALQRQYGARAVQVIGASADDPSTQAKVPPFMQRVQINFPVWLGATTADMRRFGLGEALPATAIVDRDGQIVGRIIGTVKKSDLQQRIDWLLGDRTTPAPPALVTNLEKHDHKHDHAHEHKGE